MIDASVPGIRGRFRVHVAPAPGGHVVLVVRDITADWRHTAERTLAADCDALTGIANRAHFAAQLATVIADAGTTLDPDGAVGGALAERGAAVLLLDLDGFAAINAARGQDVGDWLLRRVAERLVGAARAGDCVARVGADEFAVLMPHIAREEIAAAGQRLLAAVSAPFARGDESRQVSRDTAGPDGPLGQSVHVTASVGTVAIEGTTSVDDVLSHAAAALQRAKAAGRGQLAPFTPALHAEASARAALAAALRGALGRGEFSLAYQPVVDLRTGAPTGVEALLRWRHPDLGAVSPATFIPLAEALGVIEPIGAWVLRTACHAIAELTPGLATSGVASVGVGVGGGPGLSVAVNVSGHQLQSGSFADEVAAVLAEAGLPPARLTLEVTETALVRDPRRARRVLGELRALGVRIAIDDFGTGYSSLAYLQQLPLDVLKIDKRFVDGVARGGGPSVAIPRAIVALGGALGLRTVGEGVETAAQRDALRALGCGAGQGYLFARPLAVADLAQWLEAAPWIAQPPTDAAPLADAR